MKYKKLRNVRDMVEKTSSRLAKEKDIDELSKFLYKLQFKGRNQND